MVEGNASMYLGSPRMAEMVVGEKVSLEEMGGARMHCTVSGVGDLLAHDDAEAIELAKLYFSYVPGSWRDRRRRPMPPRSPPTPLTRDDRARARESVPFDVHEVIDGLVDDDSFFELKPLFAAELVIGFGRMDGETVGIVANNSTVKGGVLFTDSADKAARFIWLCDAFSIPLVYLADVPGFMIGSEVERGGIIRHGAKMVSAVASATVPQFCVVVRKAYGAGLYAMGGPGFAPGRDDRAARPRGSPSWVRRPRSTRSTPTRSPRSSEPRPSRDAFVAGPARASTRRTSTSSGSPPTSSSTRHRGRRAARRAAAPAALRLPPGPPLQRAPTVDPAGLSRLSADAVTGVRPRPRRPAEQPLGLGARGAAALTEQGDQVVDLVVEPAGHPDHPVLAAVASAPGGRPRRGAP